MKGRMNEEQEGEEYSKPAILQPGRTFKPSAGTTSG